MARHKGALRPDQIKAGMTVYWAFRSLEGVKVYSAFILNKNKILFCYKASLLKTLYTSAKSAKKSLNSHLSWPDNEKGSKQSRWIHWKWADPCYSCGKIGAEVYNNNRVNFASDGDKARCRHCGNKGVVSQDEGLSFLVWHLPS